MVSRPHPDWLRPDWPAPANVHALFTSRAGGCSRAPFDTLNLGDHVGDDPQAVQANRQVLQSALQAATPGARALFLQQVHGTQVVALRPEVHDGVAADACVAGTPGLVCTIMVADCLPVLLADTRGRVVAAAHAGWRGLAGQAGEGVVESVLKQFWAFALDGQAQDAINSVANEVPGSGAGVADVAARTLAWLGPCIGPQAFEVGAEVRAAFCAHDAAAAQCFQALGTGKYLADLAGLARQRLRALGITQIHGNDSTPDWCTVSQPSRFFSHRRDSASLGSSGRMAACIWLG
jgi:copper oxidase (laccase) domain-containing protein